MEAKRLHKKNKIYEELNTLNATLERDQRTIINLHSSNMDKAFVDAKVEKTNEKIKEKLLRKMELEQLLKDTERGACDKVINDELKASNDEVIAKKAEATRKRNVMLAHKAEDKERSDARWKSIKSSNANDRQKRRNIRYGYKHFCKATASLPAYMKRNLNEMPNNKGYIWKGVHFYGTQKVNNNVRNNSRSRNNSRNTRNNTRNNPYIMFEKPRRDVLHIHEWTPGEYKLYEKNGKNRKKLVKKMQRKKFNGPQSLASFMKTS